MIYHVRTGDLDEYTHASDPRQAAIKTLRNSSKSLGVCVVVKEREIDEEDHSGNLYFLTQNILDECSMRVVG